MSAEIDKHTAALIESFGIYFEKSEEHIDTLTAYFGTLPFEDMPTDPRPFLHLWSIQRNKIRSLLLERVELLNTRIDNHYDELLRQEADELPTLEQGDFSLTPDGQPP